MGLAGIVAYIIDLTITSVFDLEPRFFSFLVFDVSEHFLDYSSKYVYDRPSETQETFSHNRHMKLPNVSMYQDEYQVPRVTVYTHKSCMEFFPQFIEQIFSFSFLCQHYLRVSENFSDLSDLADYCFLVWNQNNLNQKHFIVFHFVTIHDSNVMMIVAHNGLNEAKNWL